MPDYAEDQGFSCTGHCGTSPPLKPFVVACMLVHFVVMLPAAPLRSARWSRARRSPCSCCVSLWSTTWGAWPRAWTQNGATCCGACARAIGSPPTMGRPPPRSSSPSSSLSTCPPQVSTLAEADEKSHNRIILRLLLGQVAPSRTTDPSRRRFNDHSGSHAARHLLCLRRWHVPFAPLNGTHRLRPPPQATASRRTCLPRCRAGAPRSLSRTTRHTTPRPACSRARTRRPPTQVKTTACFVLAGLTSFTSVQHLCEAMLRHIARSIQAIQ